jgi:hypothetical protein
MGTGEPFDLPFRIEQWDDADTHIEELIALVGDHRVAMAAFTETVKRRPGRIVTLRQKTRVIADSRQHGQTLPTLQERLLEIDHYGERLIGCVTCNCWMGEDKVVLVQLDEDDIAALRGVRAN